MNEISKHKPPAQAPPGTRRPGPTQDQFLRLCESLPLAVFETTADDCCLYVNPRWSEITGQLDEQVDGHGWRDAIHPSDREWVLEEVELARGQHRMFDADFKVLRPDGSIRWVHGRSLPLHQPDGTHDGFVHVIYDITDRKLTETQLRGSLKELQRQGEFQAEQIREAVAQVRDLIEEMSQGGAGGEYDRDRLRKSSEAAEAALNQLGQLAQREVEDRSLDDILF